MMYSNFFEASLLIIFYSHLIEGVKGGSSGINKTTLVCMFWKGMLVMSRLHFRNQGHGGHNQNAKPWIKGEQNNLRWYNVACVQSPEQVENFV